MPACPRRHCLTAHAALPRGPGGRAQKPCFQGFSAPGKDAAHAGAGAPGGPQSLLQCSNQNVPRMPTVTVRPGSYRSFTAFGNAKYERRSSPVRFSTLKVSCGWVLMFFSV